MSYNSERSLINNVSKYIGYTFSSEISAKFYAPSFLIQFQRISLKLTSCCTNWQCALIKIFCGYSSELFAQ